MMRLLLLEFCVILKMMQSPLSGWICGSSRKSFMQRQWSLWSAVLEALRALRSLCEHVQTVSDERQTHGTAW